MILLSREKNLTNVHCTVAMRGNYKHTTPCNFPYGLGHRDLYNIFFQWVLDFLKLFMMVSVYQLILGLCQNPGNNLYLYMGCED